jgi:tellurite methyltransferase
MSGVDKYESQYREQRGVCGEPFPEIASFFESYDKQAARILDLGCGQGRDALMAARHGHSVLGVDSSKTGIRQMLEDADAEGLSVEGVVADLTEYKIEGSYDVIILDRVLHMLEKDSRKALLKQVLQHVSPSGFVLTADMPSNKAALRDTISRDSRKWSAILDKKGFLFIRRDS